MPLLFRCLSREQLLCSLSNLGRLKEIPVTESVSIGSLSGRWVGPINTHPYYPTSNEVKNWWPRTAYYTEHGDSEAGHTQPILWLVGLAHA